MKANDVIASLAEAARTERLHYISDDQGSSAKIVIFGMTGDFSLPTFDFGDIFDPGLNIFSSNSTSALNKLASSAWNLVVNNKFFLPFEKCLYVYRYVIAGGSASLINVTTVLLCARNATNTYTIYCYEHFDNGQYKNQWWIRPLICDIDNNIPNNNQLTARFIAKANLSHHYTSTLHNHCIFDIYAVLSATMLLAEPRLIKRSTVVSTSYVSAINKKRSRKNLKPLQSIIKIDLQDPVYEPTPPFGNANPKSPHDRRGHYRHYPSGKVLFIEDMKINGGRKSPAIYDIKR